MGLSSCFPRFVAISFVLAFFPVRAHADERPDGETGARQTVPGRTLTVKLESDRTGTRLTTFELLGSGGHQGYYALDPICTAPCTATVSPAVPYRLVAPGMTPSSVFRLEPDRDADLRVHGGSWRAHVAGTLLSILGIAYIPTGGAMIGMQEAFGDPKSSGVVPVGAVMLGVGVVALAVGLPLWLGSRTRVAIDTRPRGAIVTF
jgi:hypothetical protein